MAIKYFNGRIMNHDSKRPTIGAICYKCDKAFNFNPDSQYELINIKVNHGMYDSYVLKNLKTGKTTTSVKIAIDYTVRINKHFEPINSEFSGIYASIDFDKLRDQLESVASGEIESALKSKDAIKQALRLYDSAVKGDIAAAQMLITYMFTEPGNYTGKMYGVLGLSTSVMLNPLCKACQNIGDSVCSKCYANARMYPEQSIKLALCTYVLCTYEFTTEQIPYIYASMCRFESFGDLLNKIQCANYIRIALKNSDKDFGFWSKRPAIIYHALIDKFNGVKPHNLSVVYSSLHLNQIESDIIDKFILPNGEKMIDHVFTVFTADYAIKHHVVIHCLDKKCAITCGKRCYRRDTETYVNEIVKKEQPKYMAMLAEMNH